MVAGSLVQSARTGSETVFLAEVKVTFQSALRSASAISAAGGAGPREGVSLKTKMADSYAARLSGMAAGPGRGTAAPVSASQRWPNLLVVAKAACAVTG